MKIRLECAKKGSELVQRSLEWFDLGQSGSKRINIGQRGSKRDRVGQIREK